MNKKIHIIRGDTLFHNTFTVYAGFCQYYYYQNRFDNNMYGAYIPKA